MTKDELKALRATMPWRHHVIPTRTGGLVQVLNNQGQEVPIFTMVAFLEVTTQKLAQAAEPEEEKAA